MEKKLENKKVRKPIKKGGNEKKVGKREEKDPTIALVLSLLGGFFVGIPGIGYWYLKETKKAIVHSVITLLMLGLALVLTVVSLGICAISFLFPYIYVLLVSYDTYKFAKKEKTILNFI